MPDDKTLQNFKETVWEYHAKHGRRDLPWRQPESEGSFDAYKIMVSEIMLQQTQVRRVIPKFEQFLTTFPDIRALAAAELGDVLRVWSGLGYNRRAKYLHQVAVALCENFHGRLPATQGELVSLPGIGVNTAGAILAYAYNQPVVFLETNIRTVYIHHFFRDDTGISDKVLVELVARTLDTEHPREWYWALMDYGTFLKQTVGNVSRHSAGYKKQSAFEGSKRQIRGAVLRALADGPKTEAELATLLPDKRLAAVITDLLQEALIRKQGSRLTL